MTSRNGHASTSIGSAVPPAADGIAALMMVLSGMPDFNPHPGTNPDPSPNPNPDPNPIPNPSPSPDLMMVLSGMPEKEPVAARWSRVPARARPPKHTATFCRCTRCASPPGGSQRTKLLALP